MVVRQFSLVVTSLNHPPAGIRRGVARTAERIPSSTGRIVVPDFFSGVWLLSVVMAFLPDPSGKICPGGQLFSEEGPFSPAPVYLVPERRIRRGKRSGDLFFVDNSPLTRGRVYGCPAYFRGTHTLIRKSACAAYIIEKCAGSHSGTPRFNG